MLVLPDNVRFAKFFSKYWLFDEAWRNSHKSAAVGGGDAGEHCETLDSGLKPVLDVGVSTLRSFCLYKIASKFVGLKVFKLSDKKCFENNNFVLPIVVNMFVEFGVYFGACIKTAQHRWRRILEAFHHHRWFDNPITQFVFVLNINDTDTTFKLYCELQLLSTIQGQFNQYKLFFQLILRLVRDRSLKKL